MQGWRSSLCSQVVGDRHILIQDKGAVVQQQVRHRASGGKHHRAPRHLHAAIDQRGRALKRHHPATAVEDTGVQRRRSLQGQALRTRVNSLLPKLRGGIRCHLQRFCNEQMGQLATGTIVGSKQFQPVLSKLQTGNRHLSLTAQGGETEQFQCGSRGGHGGVVQLQSACKFNGGGGEVQFRRSLQHGPLLQAQGSSRGDELPACKLQRLRQSQVGPILDQPI